MMTVNSQAQGATSPLMLTNLRDIPLHNMLAATDASPIRSLSDFRRIKTMAGRNIDYGALAVEAIALSSMERCFLAFESMTSSKTAADIIYLIHDGAAVSPWLEGAAPAPITPEAVSRAFTEAQDHRDALIRAEAAPRRIFMAILLGLAVMLSAYNILWH